MTKKNHPDGEPRADDTHPPGTPQGQLLSPVPVHAQRQSSIARGQSPSAGRGELRTILLAARQQITGVARQSANRALLSRLAEWVGSVADERVAIFWPIRGEPELGELPAYWMTAGAELALPVVEGPDQPLGFARWAPGDRTVPGLYGVPCPATLQRLRPTILVVPCLGFDRRGFRLGYGGGFYDRTLVSLAADGGPPPRTVGVAWDAAELSQFEPLATDRTLDSVVTPSRTMVAPRRTLVTDL